MEKDQTEQPEEQATEEDLIEQSVTQSTEQATVVEKKSGSGLSLLISLVALGVAGFLFYQDWMGEPTTSTAENVQPLMTQLQQANQQLSSDLKQVQDGGHAMAQQLTQLQKQLTQLQETTNELHTRAEQNKSGVASEFNNAANETALQQLDSQLLSQAQNIKALERQLASQPAAQVSENLGPGVLEQMRKGTAIQTLISTQTLLATNQIEAAKGNLSRYLMSAKVNDGVKNKMRVLSSRIEQLQVVDSTLMRQELQALAAAIEALQLPTIESAQESKWYDRFVSVKKISDESAVNSSIRLGELKLQISRLLYQAGVYLTMQNEMAWQDTLNQAAVQMGQQLPQEKVLINRLQSLAAQKITVKIPTDLGIAELVEELEGSSP